MAEKTIWKFRLLITDIQQISLPKGSEVLTVQVQDGYACMWALVNLGEEPETRSFEVFGTGHNIPPVGPNGRRYVGTFQLGGGRLVFHVFELYK